MSQQPGPAGHSRVRWDLLILAPAAWATGAALFALPWHTFLAALLTLAVVAAHPALRAPGIPARIRLLLGAALLLMAAALATYVHAWQPLPDAGLPGFDRTLPDQLTDPSRRRSQLFHDVVLATTLALSALTTAAALAHLPRARLRGVPRIPTKPLVTALTAAAFTLLAATATAWSTVSGEIQAADLRPTPDTSSVEMSAAAVFVAVAPTPDLFTALTVAALLTAATLSTLACARLATPPSRAR